MMKVLVTGSAGLIGRWVCERLRQEGHHFVGLDLRAAAKPEWASSHYQADILDAKEVRRILQKEKPEGLIHLAARCDLEGICLEDYKANREGVRNLCRALRECPSVQRAIYTSSQLVCRIGYLPKSDSDYCPDTLYGESKVCTERIVREEEGGGTEWALARPTTVWGPYMSDHYQGVLRHIRRGTYFHSGKGELKKSYAYAGNIAFQYFKLLTAPAMSINKKVFFLADYDPLSLRHYCDSLAREMGARRIPTLPLPLARSLALFGDILNRVGMRKFPYNSFRLKNIRTEYVYDMGPTQTVCGDLPYNFEQGVRQTARWFQNDVCDSPR